MTKSVVLARQKYSNSSPLWSKVWVQGQPAQLYETVDQKKLEFKEAQDK